MDPLSGVRSVAGSLSSVPARTVDASSLAPGASAPDKAASARDFSDFLGGAIADAAAKLRSAEAVSISGLKGTAPVQDVVEQVMAAEQALQSAIAVRDKIVAAYLEISRMAI